MNAPLLGAPPDDLLKAMLDWLLDDFRTLRRTNHGFLKHFDDAFVAHAKQTVRLRHDELVRSHRLSAPMHLTLWHGSIDLRPVLREELARLLLTTSDKMLCELVPHFLKWLESAYAPQERQELLELLLQQMKNGEDNRHKRLLKRQIMAAGTGWSSAHLPNPLKVQEDLARLTDLLAAAETNYAVVVSACESVAEGLAASTPDEADEVWDTLAPLVVKLPHEHRAEPLFAMAIHLRCLSVLKQGEAFGWICEGAGMLGAANEVVVLEGLVVSVDCLGSVGRRAWCDLLLGKVTNTSAASRRLSFLPACCASLKTLAPEDRAVRFAKIFEVEMPNDPSERSAWLGHLSQCVEFLDKPDRAAKVKALANTVLRIKGNAEPIALHLIDQARALDAQEVANVAFDAYTRLIFEAPDADAVRLDALFAAICVPANASVLEAVLKHVLDKLDSLATAVWAKSLSPRACAACLGVVAVHLHRLPVEAFARISDQLIRIMETRPDLHVWIGVDVTALSRLLHCPRMRFMCPAEIGDYVKRLWNLSRRCGALEEMDVSFQAVTHLMPDSDQLLVMDVLLRRLESEAADGQSVCRLFGSALHFTHVGNRLGACRRLIKCLYESPLNLARTCSDAEIAPPLQILEKLLATVPEDEAFKLQVLMHRLQGGADHQKRD